jgi:hypothetical protein
MPLSRGMTAMQPTLGVCGKWWSFNRSSEKLDLPKAGFLS